jgi:hypothetical protein
LAQGLSPEQLVLGGQPPSLVVAWKEPFSPESPAKTTILLSEVVNYVLLVLIDPAGKYCHKDMPRAQVVEHPAILHRMNNWTNRFHD